MMITFSFIVTHPSFQVVQSVRVGECEVEVEAEAEEVEGSKRNEMSNFPRYIFFCLLGGKIIN